MRGIIDSLVMPLGLAASMCIVALSLMLLFDWLAARR